MVIVKKCGLRSANMTALALCLSSRMTKRPAPTFPFDDYCIVYHIYTASVNLPAQRFTDRTHKCSLIKHNRRGRCPQRPVATITTGHHVWCPYVGSRYIVTCSEDAPVGADLVSARSAILHRADTRSAPTSIYPALHIKPKQHNVSVLHHIFLALRANKSLRPRRCHVPLSL